MMAHKVTRLDFLKKTGLVSSGIVIGANTGAGFAVPEIIPSGAVKGTGKKINLALIGIANQGAVDAKEFINTGMANIVAVADVDLNSKGCQETLKLVPKAKRFRDFREMFDKMSGDIDAVVVAIPDFAHFPASMAAIQLGKHVFVEKPMCHTFYECELLARAAENNPKLATQVGNQGHSGENYFQFKAWKEAGIIKDVTAVTAHMNGKRRWHPYDPDITKFPPAQLLPEGMTEKDWDTWLATAGYHDYNEMFHNGNWRGWYDFGMGALGDWGAHIIDTIHEFLELGLPYEINPLHVKNLNDYFFPLETTLQFRFASRGEMPPCDLTWYDGVDNLPPFPAGYDTVENAIDNKIPPPGGTKEQGGGNIAVNQTRPVAGKIIYSKELTFKGTAQRAPLSIIPAEKARELAPLLPPVPESPSDHYQNFLLACMGKEKTRSSFRVFAPLCQIFCLGIIAVRRNRKLLFNPETKEITNDKFANAMLSGMPPRKGWESYYV